VEFDTRKPLGLRLDSTLRVTGFHRSDSEKGPAEASGWVRKGDVLVAVSEAAVAGLNLPEVGRRIAKADLPKRLRFRDPHGGNREAEVRELRQRPGGVEGVTGRLVMSRNGIEELSLRFVQAEFGGRTGCWEAPVVWASPVEACGAFKNAAAVMDSIVIAQRGLCPFSAKATNAEQYAARGIVIVNADDEAMVMPRDPSSGDDVSLPVVSIGSADGKRLLRAVMQGGDVSELAMRVKHSQEARGPASAAPSGDDADAEVPEALLRPQPHTMLRLLVDGQYCGPVIAAPGGLGGGDEEQGDEDAAGAADDAPARLALPAGQLSLVLGGTVEATADGGAAEAWVAVRDGAGPVEAEYLLAEYAPSAPAGSFRVVVSDPPSGCAVMLTNAAEVRGSAVLMDRGLCSFGAKLAAARAAGAALVVAVNTEPGLAAVASKAAQTAEEDGAGAVPPAVTITRGAGRRIRAALGAGEEVMARLDGVRGLEGRWEELTDMLEHTRWPRNARTRRKLFYRMSKSHHPDKPGGSQDRFELLGYAWRRAGHRWSPEGSTFVDDFAG